MADQTINIDLLINTAESATKVSDVRKAIKDIKSAMNEVGDTSSADFLKLASAAGELQHKMEETNRAISALRNNASKIEALAGATKKVAAGFEAATAASALFGEKNEDVEKALLKVQAAASMTRAIGEFAEFGDAAQKAGIVIKAAFADNPLTVILIALTAVVAGVYGLIQAFSDERTESEKLIVSLNKQKDALDNLQETNDAEIKYLESRLSLYKKQKKSSAEIEAIETQINQLKRKGLDTKKQDIELTRKQAIAEITEGKKKIKNKQDLEDAIKKINDKAAADQEVQSEQINTMSLEAEGQQLDDKKAAADEEKKLKDKAAEEAKKRREKEAADNAAAIKAAEDASIEAIKNDEAREISKSDLQEQRDLDAINNSTASEENKSKARIAITEKYDKLQDDIRAKFQKQREDAQAAADTKEIEAAKTKLQAEVAAEKEAADTIFLNSAQEGEDKKALLQANLAAELKLYSDDAIKRAELEAKEKDDEAKIDKAAADESKKQLEEKFKSAEEYANKAMGIIQQIADLQNQKDEEEMTRSQELSDKQVADIQHTADQELQNTHLTANQKIAIQNKAAMDEYKIKLAQYNSDIALKKKLFEKNKKMSIATTAIAGAIAVVQAFATSPTPIVGAVFAALAAVTTALSIAKISSQQFDAGGGPPEAPVIQAMAGSGGNSQNALQRIGGGAGTGMATTQQAGQNQFNNPNAPGAGHRMAGPSNQPQKVYVVSQDMTNSQNGDAVLQRRASFGQ